MPQCIRLGCKNDAWEDNDKKSYFCIACAYTMMRGHLVLSPEQLEIFNQEGFIDHLCGKSTTGYRPNHPHRELLVHRFGGYVEERQRRASCFHHHIADYHTCLENSCGKPIIGAARRCGACRRRKGLSEDEDRNPPKIKCSNWNWEQPGVAAPGHHLTSTCLKQFPADRARRIEGLTLCPMCWSRLRLQDREFFKIYGYPELTRFYENQDARYKQIERESKS